MMTRNALVRRPRGHGRRGTALVEFAMVIPLLALIIGLTFFFGWTMTNQQHVWVSSRYAAWRQVRPGDAVGNARLNSVFFEDRAADVGIERGLGQAETLAELVAAVGQMGQAAEQHAGMVVWNRCPRGRTATVAAEFPSDVGLWRRFSGAIRGYHARDGRQWRCANGVTCEVELRDQFLLSLDSMVEQMQSARHGLGERLRRTYLESWPAWRQ